MKQHYIFLMLTMSVIGLHAQKPTTRVQRMLKSAQDSLIVGNIDASLKLIASAEKLAPKNKEVQFEKAYAFYLGNQYDTAIVVLKNLIKIDSISNQDYYLLLGNSFDLNKDPKAALDIYRKGIEKFPNSGKLRYESGILAYGEQNYNEAVKCWEEGIKKEPSYPDNYYMLAKTFSFTKEKIWALLYGEMFMNLEQDTERTAEISKLLFETYAQSYIKFKNNGYGFYLTQNKAAKTNSSFEAYCMQLANKSIPQQLSKRHLTIEEIYIVRNQFLKNWFQSSTSTNYSNKFFQYQKAIQEKGWLEAYTYWLLSEGNFEAYDAWLNSGTNEYKLAHLKEYLTNHRLTFSTSDHFIRTDYFQE